MAAPDPARWGKIKAIFGEIYDLPVEERLGALARLCPADLDIREEVKALLDTAQAASGLLASAPAAAVGLPPFGGTARFAIRRALGSGSFGTVYEAWDSEWDRPVALKVLKDASPAFLALFKHEFRSLAGIAHPNLVRLHELFVEGPYWFFSMDLLEGVDLLSWVRPAGAADYGRLREAFAQVVEAVAFLHRLRRVHRDLKPANVLVAAQGQATVLDFGLIMETGREAAHRNGPIAGSPAYMAPEQAQERTVGPAADWYALGVMLFQALTGRLPFRGSEAEILAHKAQTAPLPREWDRGIPDDWSRLCGGLLDPDPDARPGAAELRAFFQAGFATAEKRAAPPEERFVGRESWIEELRNDFGRALRGRLVVSIVEGPSGIGKSALVRQFLERLARDHDVLVLTGRCYECESVPYKALDAWIDQLAEYLCSLAARELDQVLPQDASLLPILFPVLGRMRSAGMEAHIAIPDGQELRRRAFSALVELLARLSPRRRVVIWVDDFQWGDLDSIAFLRELFSSGSPGLLFLITYRSEDRASSSSIRALLNLGEGLASIHLWRVRQLGALPPDESRELAAHLAGSAGADAERIARESGGVPIFLEELAHWSARGPVPASLGDAIRERIQRLPETAARLAAVVALAGQPLQQRTAVRAAPGTSNQTIALCVGARLVRLQSAGSEVRLESYHDQVRAAALATIEPSSRRLLHRSLAEALSSDPEADPDNLIDHYVGAGDLSTAGDCALRAADGAMKALAFERAAHLLARAMELKGATAALWRRRGEALSYAGRGRDAADAYLSGARLAPRRESFELRHLAGGQLLRAGRIDQGLPLLCGLLAELGVVVPRARWRLLAALVWYRLRAAVEHPHGRRAPADPLLLDTLWTGASVLVSATPAPGAYCHARFWLLARRSQDPRRLALATAFEAANRAVFGWRHYEKANAILAQAEAIAARVDDPYLTAMNSLMRAFVAYLTGRLPQIHTHAAKAEQLFRNRCRGVFWEITSARVLQIYTAGLTGENTNYRAELDDLIQEARTRSDTYTESSLVLITFSHRPSLFSDRPEEAIAALDRALQAWGRKEWDLQAMGYCVAISETLLYAGRAPDAAAMIHKWWKPAVHSLLLRWQILNILLTHVRGRCALAVGDQRETRACMRRLMATRSPYGRAAALSLRASMAVSNDRAGAIAALREAVVTFEQIGLQLYAVACRRRLAELESDAASLAAADAWMRDRHIQRPQRIAAWVLPGKWGEHGNDAN